ncbi:MAG: VIT1/CCC1 transporter family protein [Candidatus Korarchaeota archaeon]
MEEVKLLRNFWTDEIVSTAIYKFMAKHKAKSETMKENFLRLSEMEAQHANLWASIAEKATGKKFSKGIGTKMKIIQTKLLALIMPLSFMVYYLELEERTAVIQYSKIYTKYKSNPELYEKIFAIIKEEIGHEITLLEMLLGIGTKIGNVKEAIYGMTDSLVEILALVIGLAGVIGDPLLVGLAGFISAVGGTFSMASGSFLGARSERDIYYGKIRELEARAELGDDMLLNELEKVFMERGIPKDDARKVCDSINTFSPHVLKNILQGLTTSEPDSPSKVAKVTGLYYVIGAMPAVIPFIMAAIFGANVTIAIVFALIGAIIVSGTAGIFTAVLSGMSIKKKSASNILIVIGAAIATYIIATLARMFLGIEV